ncbi:MAG: Gfo/Idh/MocA family oxidoreductase [Sphaerochaetaceae bacterium]|nr:Gfo/Idh/MocA family oxidoreductase [Sphaerochaetaceae bacterium]
MKIAILGAGRIARKMAYTICHVEGAEPYAVASRTLEKAEEFAAEFGFSKAYGSYDEMLADPAVELVYVATPHSHHYANIMSCLEHGKPVLCEKAFTVNADQARKVFASGREKGLLVAEAIWTRYLPMRKVLDDVLASGVIGPVTSLTANLGYSLKNIQRLTDPALAGGALLDVGVYPINFAFMVFGGEYSKVDSTVVKLDTGVDACESITLAYPDGKLAMLHCSMLSSTDRRGMIFGEKGYIEVLNINNCEGIRVFDTGHRLAASYETPRQINGFEYELEACMEAVRLGDVECPQMPHSETVKVLELTDSLRAKWDVRYPME